MQIMQWNPFREMDDLLTRFQRGFGRPVGAESDLESWAPAVDISEKDKEYLVKAELPGVSKDDVRVNVQNGVLTVSGERKLEKEEKDEKHHRIERAYGSFMRSFSLPDDAQEDKIAADYKDGVLCVHVPKAEVKESQAKQIKVQ